MAGHCPVLPRLPVLGAPVRFGDRVRRDSLGVQQRQEPLGLPRQDPALAEDQLGPIGVLESPSRCASGMRRPSSRSSRCARARLLL